MSHEKKLDLLIVYEKSGDKLRDNDAKRAETVGSVKARVLVAFGLQEGEEHGKLTTYSLFHDNREVTEPDESIGELAGESDRLHLELARERYRFFYKELKILSELQIATGAQIKAMIKAADPSFDLQHELILEGDPDKVINDSEPVSLEVGKGHPVKHFFSKPPTSFGA
jgi:hypothetical protein